MPDTSENFLGLVSSCFYYAHKTRDIYQILPYSVDFKAPRKVWNPVVLFGANDLLTSEMTAKLILISPSNL